MTKAVLLSLLDRPVTLPLTPLLEKVATHLCRTKLSTSNEKSILKLKTNGQPLVFQKRTMLRKSSSLASSPTKKKRSHQAKRFNIGIGGKAVNDQRAQLASNFKRNPKEIRAELLKKSNVKVIVGAKQSLAFKEATNMTWSTQKEAMRILKTNMGVRLASQKEQKKVYKEIVKGKVMIDNIAVEKKTTAGQASKQVPMGRVPDLQKFMFNLLDNYDKQGSLFWQDVGIPDNEVWVKIGGDHGQGSLKICLEIANLEKPNARENTHIVGMIEERDSYEVLEDVTLNLNFDIKKLQSTEWHGKTIKVFSLVTMPFSVIFTVFLVLLVHFPVFGVKPQTWKSETPSRVPLVIGH